MADPAAIATDTTSSRSGDRRAVGGRPAVATRGKVQHQLLGIRSPLAGRWRLLLGVLGVGLVFLVWVLAASRGDSSSVLVPTPAATWRALADMWSEGTLWTDLWASFQRVLIGYGIYLLSAGDATSGLWMAVLGYLLWQSARGAVVQSAVTSRLEGVTVADIMDADPVTVPADMPVERAYEEFFLRYQGWPWFAVVEADGRYAGIAHRAAVESAALGHAGVPVRELAADSAEVRDDAPLEALLGSESLRRLGALMAVDADGRLRGVVTLEQVSRALQARLAPRAG